MLLSVVNSFKSLPLILTIHLLLAAWNLTWVTKDVSLSISSFTSAFANSSSAFPQQAILDFHLSQVSAAPMLIGKKKSGHQWHSVVCGVLLHIPKQSTAAPVTHHPCYTMVKVPHHALKSPTSAYCQHGPEKTSAKPLPSLCVCSFIRLWRLGGCVTGPKGNYWNHRRCFYQ